MIKGKRDLGPKASEKRNCRFGRNPSEFYFYISSKGRNGVVSEQSGCV